MKKEIGFLMLNLFMLSQCQTNVCPARVGFESSTGGLKVRNTNNNANRPVNLYVSGQLRAKKSRFVDTPISSKFDNPDEIRDRIKGEIKKPAMPEAWKNRYKKPFNPAWMDYCDPYHCNDYHKRACGLNRQTMRFKWFQSGCHVALGNMCASYRGTLKYDIIENKFCAMYVMFLRASCPSSCDMEALDPTCAISTIDNHAVLFKNTCSMDAANCRDPVSQEYEEVDMKICEYYLLDDLKK